MFDFLRHFLWPHHSNNQRAKILHHYSLFILTGALLVFQSLISLAQYTLPQVLGYASQIPVDSILTLTNQKRAAAGVGPLTLNDKLSDAARRKAADMFAKNYWAHNSPDGTKPWAFILAAGYNYIHAGENLARDFNNAPAVVDAWMNSPTHRENLLNPRYQNIGLAVVDGNLTGVETTLVVQMFGTPQSQAPKVTDTGSSVVRPALAAVANPTPTPAVLQQETTKPEEKQVEIPSPSVSPIIPLFNTFNLSKTITLAFALLILVVLCIDWLVAWQKNLIRLSGKNWAHLTYIGIIIILALLLKPGLII